MSKRKMQLILSGVMMLLLVMAVPVSAAGEAIKIKVNGNLLVSDAKPMLVNAKVMVPLRAVAEALNAKVYWFAEDGKVEVKKGFREIRLWIPKGDYYSGFVDVPGYAYVNGEYIDLDVTPRVVNGTTYVPLRLLSEGLGAKVTWDKKTLTVSIEMPELKALEGESASVRDSVYRTVFADSFRLKADVQLKFQEYPQLNVIKLNGDFDKNGNWYTKGHAGGWFFEGLNFNSKYYIKSALFNDSWVGLTELVGEREAQEMQEEKNEAEVKFKEYAYDYITETIRALGKPEVVIEEKINGVMCRKIKFTPTVESINAFMGLKESMKDLESASLVLWIGKSDNLVHKSDFLITSKTPDSMSKFQGKEFVHSLLEISDIEGDFKVNLPGDFTKQ